MGTLAARDDDQRHRRHERNRRTDCRKTPQYLTSACLANDASAIRGSGQPAGAGSVNDTTSTTAQMNVTTPREGEAVATHAKLADALARASRLELRLSRWITNGSWTRAPRR
jgi:hypothetical protein